MHAKPKAAKGDLRWILAAACLAAPAACAQAPAELAAPAGSPIAIVPIDSSNAATVTGALEVTGGKAIIAANGSITSGERTIEVVLPHRGLLRVCASTTIKLAANTSAQTGETPGLLMAIDRGAVEMSFANPRAADSLLTPYFRILVAGPGSSDVKVRLGNEGDTCVDNSVAANGKTRSQPADAPYVVVTSVFDSGLYRVEPGQRVMFQHGSLTEVVDNEKEPCGCPPPPSAAPNEFPLAQSEGLAPGPATLPAGSTAQTPASGALVYNSSQKAPQMTPVQQTPSAAAPAAPAEEKKPGIFTRIGRFFRRVFGAE
jgi:hypothetical protein